MQWFAEKVTGKHNGTILFSSGEIQKNQGKLSAVFEVDMNSIVNTDIEDAGYRAKLEGHLKSADFFDAAAFPTAKFVSTSITPVKNAKEGGFTHSVKGNLTIKDKTNPIAFDVVIKTDSNNMVVVGTAVVDRSKFDIRYGSRSFFPEIGDKMINDEFTLKFNIVATKSPINE
jgi:polyisoprenoid-binding protein YceI